MARVTYDDVMEIMDSGIEVSNTQVASMIKAANAVIDTMFGEDNLPESHLMELERWLTAHYIASTIARMAEKEKVGQAEITYVGKWGELLKATPYGQALLTMDTTGKLAKAGKRVISMYAIPSFED